MCKRISLILVLLLTLGFVCAHAEQNQFLISDWKLLYTLGDLPIDEQTVFIYEDNTFEVMTDTESQRGFWSFDGNTLTLSGGDESLSLKWNESQHRFAGEYGGMKITMYMPIEPESGKQPVTAPASPAGSRLAGGWTIPENPAVTEEIGSIFFQALDSWQTGTITVSYTPVLLLGKQVVAGTQYAVLSKASEINKGTRWVILYVYQDLSGNASVQNMTDVPLGI